MKVKYSQHIEHRLRLRGIDSNLPQTIYEQAEERYFDEETQYYIAVMKHQLYGKMRDIMVAYSIEGGLITLITIHALKEGQKQNRVRSGRWRKIK
jgi:hypothetical protein